MVYGELGVMPLAVDIKCRVITFWSKIIGTEESNKLSHEIYKIIYVLHENNRLKSQWISNLKKNSFALWGLPVFGIHKFSLI